MKRIWYINPYAGGPGVGRPYRPFYLASAWCRQEISTLVVTSSFHHLMYERNSVSGHEKVGGVDYYFVPTSEYRGNGLSRILSMLMFSFGLLRLLFFIRSGRPDAIVYSSPHLFGVIPAKLLAWRYRVPFVLEVRDIWPMSLVEIAGASRLHPFVMVNALLEKLAYLFSDKIVGLAPGLSKYIGDKKAVLHVPNGILRDAACLLEEPTNDAFRKISAYLDDRKRSGKTIGIYAGSHGVPNALDQFINAAKRIKELGRTDVQLVFVGDGVEKERLVSKTEFLGLDNVMFFPAIERESLYWLYGKVDFAVIGWLDLPIYQYGVSPNKLSEYMLFGLPVIHAVNACDEPVSKSGGGVLVPPGDALAIADAIVQLVDLGGGARKKIGKNGFEYIVKEFDYDELAVKYLEFIF